MIIDEENIRVQYESTKESPILRNDVLPYPYRYTEKDQIYVLEGEVNLARNEDFSVSQDGSITILKDIPAGTVITIYRSTPLDQGSEFPQEAPFSSRKIEDALDKLTMQNQEQREALGRALKLPLAASLDLSDISMPIPEPNRSVKWNSEGTALINTSFDPDIALVLTEQYRTEAQAAAEVATASRDVTIEKAKIATEKAAVATTQATKVEDIYTEAVPVLNKIITNGQSALSNTITQGQQSLANASDALRQTQITNCILSVEELVKVSPSLDNGQLVLKKGSIVYVSTNGTFKEVTIQSDIGTGSTGLFTNDGRRDLLACYVPSIKEIRNIPVYQTYSQATAPTASMMLNNTFCGWLDTTNNIMKYTYDGGATWTVCSLPFALGNPQIISGGGLGWVGKLKVVFNGFGVVGQKTFTTRGVRALLPNGKTTDETFNNKETVSTSLTFTEETGKSSWICFFDGTRILTYGVTNYFEQEEKPTGFTGSATWLNTQDNVMYNTSNGGDTWTKTGSLRCYLGKLVKAGNGVITEFEPNKPVELVKKADLNRAFDNLDKNLVEVKAYIIKIYIANNGATGYIIWSNGYCEQWGEVIASKSWETFLFLKTFANANYSIFGSCTNNGKASFTTAGTGNGCFASFMGLTTTSFQLQTSDDGTFNGSYCRWRACGYLASGQY